MHNDPIAASNLRWGRHSCLSLFGNTDRERAYWFAKPQATDDAARLEGRSWFEFVLPLRDFEFPDGLIPVCLEWLSGGHS
jgi:hypothetical protein